MVNLHERKELEKKKKLLKHQKYQELVSKKVASKEEDYFNRQASASSTTKTLTLQKKESSIDKTIVELIYSLDVQTLASKHSHKLFTIYKHCYISEKSENIKEASLASIIFDYDYIYISQLKTYSETFTKEELLQNNKYFTLKAKTNRVSCLLTVLSYLQEELISEIMSTIFKTHITTLKQLLNKTISFDFENPNFKITPQSTYKLINESLIEASMHIKECISLAYNILSKTSSQQINSNQALYKNPVIKKVIDDIAPLGLTSLEYDASYIFTLYRSTKLRAFFSTNPIWSKQLFMYHNDLELILKFFLIDSNKLSSYLSKLLYKEKIFINIPLKDFTSLDNCSAKTFQQIINTYHRFLYYAWIILLEHLIHLHDHRKTL